MVLTLLAAFLMAQGTWTRLPGSNSKEAARLKVELHAKMENYSMTAGSLADALTDVAGRFRIPMGIVWVRTPSAMKPIRLSWKTATVLQVIEDIVHTQAGYEIQFRNAIVHVYPGAMIPDRENFLKLKVAEFKQENQVAELASRRLGALMTLQVAPPKPSVGGVGGDQGVEVGDPEISISLNNVSAEDVLDCISLASPFKIWLVTFAEVGNVTPTGFRRTVSPVTGEAVTDEYQPGWELLRWGRTPY